MPLFAHNPYTRKVLPPLTYFHKPLLIVPQKHGTKYVSHFPLHLLSSVRNVLCFLASVIRLKKIVHHRMRSHLLHLPKYQPGTDPDEPAMVFLPPKLLCKLTLVSHLWMPKQTHLPRHNNSGFLSRKLLL